MMEFNRSGVVASGGGMVTRGKGTIQMNEDFILLLRVPYIGDASYCSEP